MTRILSRSQVEELLEIDEVFERLRDGFVAHERGLGPRPLRVRTDLPTDGTSATALLPGVGPGRAAYTVKVNAKFPDARPALRGVVCLHDATDGRLLALLDSAAVTAWRTGLAAAVMTHELARPDADGVAVIGAGAQARRVLDGLGRLRPLGVLQVHDSDPARADAFAASYAVPAQVAHSAREALAAADIVITATWSRTPVLTRPDLRRGAHVSTLGADEPGKVEVGADVLEVARLVVDDVDLALAMGAAGNAGLGPEAIAATAGAVLAGTSAGRESADQLTVYAPVGLAWQDLVLAEQVYERALDVGAGVEVDLLA